MTLAIAIAAAAAVAVAGFVIAGNRALAALSAPDDPARAPGAHVLRYHSDGGLDASAVIDAVRAAGYHATTDYESGRVDIIVLCTGDPRIERERVRAAISGAPDRQGIAGDRPPMPVRFVDEAR